MSDPVGIAYISQKKIYDYRGSSVPFDVHRLNVDVLPSDHSNVVRPRIARLLGKGLGWVEGEEEHKRMRRLAMPALT